MPTDILDDARKYLVDALKGKHNSFESKHGWRKDWEFAVLHSLRVEAYVMRILEREPRRLAESELTLLRLAAILHDIVRLDIRKGHAVLGAEVAGKWLRGHTDLGGAEIERVVAMIAAHSNKGSDEQDYCKTVLQDADTLDEIGVMSIFMASNWLDQQSPFFFRDLRERLVHTELPFCDMQMSVLNTTGAKEILREKRVYIEGFIAQLDDELRSTGELEKLLDKR